VPASFVSLYFSHSQDRAQYGLQALKRLKEIIDEGPDLIVYGHSGGDLGFSIDTVIAAVSSSPNWQGSLVFAPGKQVRHIKKKCQCK